MKKSNLNPFLVLITISLITALVITPKSIAADCNWTKGDPHKMHWPQEPDLSSTGVDISMYIVTLADDFKCSSTGPINDIHIWGSFINDTLPPDGPDSLAFDISIYSDIPAQGDNISKPGNLLWTRRFRPGEYTVERVYDGPEDWYDPPRSRYYPDNHRYAFQYNFCIESDPFVQQEGTIYWLAIDELAPDFPDYKFGWKTTTRDLQWNDNAVYQIDGYVQWNEMTYPSEHEYKYEIIDLAFVITGGEESQNLYDWGDAPDGAAAAGYPTLSFNNGANHVIDGPWLGNDDGFPDAELNGQPESDALGDDLDIALGPPNDDEDGVSIPPMYQGHPGDITLKVNGGGGFVDAWIDFNKDMTWDPNEKICWWFLPDGMHTITFIVPDVAALGKTFARFRISDEGSLPPWGSADSGEVEDYTVNIYENCGQCTGMEFIRGDANHDGEINDADVTFIMQYALSGAPKPACMDAADVDDNGIVDLSDATFLLHYLNGGPIIPQPFPDCGPDPTNDTLTCDQYDYCLGCTTTTRYAKWFQLPDVTHNGIDIRVDSNDGYIRSIADDFECQFESLLTDVHLWGSWKNDIKGIIENIHLSIHYDDPAGPLGPDPNNLFSKPAPDVIWEMNFPPKHFKETLYYTLPEPGEWWWDPVNYELVEGGDKQIWRIDIDIDPNMAFLQQGSIDNPRIYWLDVRVDANNGEFGWKTRRWPDHFMDDAVWDVGSELPRIWKELRYPKGHPYEGLERDSIDMAFCLTYTPGEIDQPTTTIMPVAPTQCPVVATQCPTVTTRCPPSRTQCPVVRTQCPPLETQCVAITTCPPTDTTCPVAPTQCPISLTECPVYETRCPATETICAAITMCPPKDTTCPIAPTQCPISLTECPVYETRCPVQQTKCPPTETECQVVTTVCPRSYTYCPETETVCTIEDTRCPPVDTECPVEETQCPPMETQCQLVTMCPPMETECPVAYTKCPTISTLCPGYETRCPASETECPVYTTRCPPAVTQCENVPTQCPMETECPVAHTKCPTTDTECPYIETECPEILTECPPSITLCSGGEICPTTVYPDCVIVTMTPDCGVVTITPDCQITTFPCVLGSYGSSSARKCPVVETTCPTVISVDLQANAK